MVRSPARGSSSSSSSRNRRRIETSSEELEEQAVTSPRKSRLSRVSLPHSESDDDAEGESESSAVGHHGGERLAASTTRATAEDAEEQEDSGEQAETSQNDEEEEKYRIWEMFADEYHDIVEQLPLELQRSFQLMLEHDEQMRAHEKALENATIEYISLAKSDAYADAMIKAQLARKMAANLGDPPSAPSAYNVQSQPSQVNTAAVTAPLDTALSSNGFQGATGGDSGTAQPQQVEDEASMSSDEAVQTALLRPLSPSKQGNTQNEESSNGAGQHQESDGESAEHLRKLLGDIVTHSRAAIKAGEDKVALAVTAYNWVDRHIHRLDSDALKHEESLSLGLRAGTLPSTDAQDARGHAAENADLSHLQDANGLPGGGKGAMAYDGRIASGSGSKARPSKSSRKRDNKRKSKSASVAFEEPLIATTSSEGDPLQPYCYCQTPSLGVMVGCDNDDCPRQWFHLACLNLTAPPEVEPWYCKECAASLAPKKKKSKKARR